MHFRINDDTDGGYNRLLDLRVSVNGDEGPIETQYFMTLTGNDRHLTGVELNGAIEDQLSRVFDVSDLSETPSE